MLKKLYYKNNGMTENKPIYNHSNNFFSWTPVGKKIDNY